MSKITPHRSHVREHKNGRWSYDEWLYQLSVGTVVEEHHHFTHPGPETVKRWVVTPLVWVTYPCPNRGTNDVWVGKVGDPCPHCGEGLTAYRPWSFGGIHADHPERGTIREQIQKGQVAERLGTLAATATIEGAQPPPQPTRWLLNSAVLAAGAYGTYTYEPASVADLKAFVQAGPVESRIGYEETAAMIERWTGIRPAISREGSPLAAGDVAMVVRLRYRVVPGAKGAPTQAGEDDWEIARLTRLA